MTHFICTDDRLPGTLHELLKASVEDAQKLEATGKYVLDMQIWHRSMVLDNKCHICMAGALLVTKLDAEPHMALEPDSIYDTQELYEGEDPDPSSSRYDITDRLLAVNGMRTGNMYGAYLFAYGDGGSAKDLSPKESEVMSWARDTIRGTLDVELGRAPWDVYLKVADRLKEVGI